MVKLNRIKCTARDCGKEMPMTKFYVSHSNLYSENSGRMPICKECFYSKYKELLIKYNDEVKALYHACMMFDIYYDKGLISKSQENIGNDELGFLKTYMKNVNSLNQYKGKCSTESMSHEILDEDTIRELENKYQEEIESLKKEEDIYEEIDYDKIPISNNIRKYWGSGYSNEDYIFLEETYKEFTDVYESRTPAQRLIFKNIAKSLLEGDKALRNNSPKIFENMNNVVSKLMTDGNIKPIQEASVAEDDTASWGKWINLIEQERPIGEPLEQFKDVDKISSYVTKWFTRQMQRVFDLSTGEKNDN
ncbi:MAG: hypothetical protein ACRCX2_36020 [Paraclostridium sp.]